MCTLQYDRIMIAYARIWWTCWTLWIDCLNIVFTHVLIFWTNRQHVLGFATKRYKKLIWCFYSRETQCAFRVGGTRQLLGTSQKNHSGSCLQTVAHRVTFVWCGVYLILYIFNDSHKFWLLSHQSLCFVSASGQSENCHRTALKDVYCFLHPWPLAVVVSILCCVALFYGRLHGVLRRLLFQKLNSNDLFLELTLSRVQICPDEFCWTYDNVAPGQSQCGNPGTWVFAHRKKEAHTSKLKASCDGSWKM